MFFKTVEDAARLRLRISECFERAALPQTSPEARAGLAAWAGGRCCRRELGRRCGLRPLVLGSPALATACMFTRTPGVHTSIHPRLPCRSARSCCRL